MVQADSEPPTPAATPPDDRRHLLWIAIGTGVIVVAALIIVAVRSDENTPGASSSADASTAMCPAIPLADQVLPSIVTIAASRGAQAGTGSGQIFQDGGYILTNDHVISVAAGAGGIWARGTGLLLSPRVGATSRSGTATVTAPTPRSSAVIPAPTWRCSRSPTARRTTP